MESVGFFEAWQLWGSGEEITDRRMGWWSILWWGRIGKLLGLAGIVLIVAQLVGPCRLNALVKSLRDQLDFPAIWVPFRRVIVRMTRDEQLMTDSLWYVISTAVGSLVVGAILLAASGAVLLWTSSSGDIFGGPLWKDIVAVVSIVFFAFTSLSSLMLLIPLSVATLATVLVSPIEVLARLLRGGKLADATRIATVFIILTGFQFDILAS